MIATVLLKLFCPYYLELIFGLSKGIRVLFQTQSSIYPVGNYMFKVNSRNSKTNCEIYSELTINTSEQNH